MVNNYKIINDPVHGFINIPSGLIQEIIEHPYFQRLRDIKQLGMTNLVYPGATHSRLIHAIGAMHLMKEAIVTLRSKGIDIDLLREEDQCVQCCCRYRARLSAIPWNQYSQGEFHMRRFLWL